MKKKRTLYHYLDRQEEAYRNNKTKSLIDFDDEYVSSVKSLAMKKCFLYQNLIDTNSTSIFYVFICNLSAL